MELHPVYNTENKNKLPPRSPGKCKSHTPTDTGKQQQCLKIYWESSLSNNSSRHTNKVCIARSLSRWIGEREKVTVRKREEREKARVGVKVELSSKQSQIPPPPPQSQVNWIIRSQGRYRHHLPWIAHETTSVWLHHGKASSLRTLSLNIQGTLNEEVMNLS